MESQPAETPEFGWRQLWASKMWNGQHEYGNGLTESGQLRPTEQAASMGQMDFVRSMEGRMV